MRNLKAELDKIKSDIKALNGLSDNLINNDVIEVPGILAIIEEINSLPGKKADQAIINSVSTDKDGFNLPLEMIPVCENLAQQFPNTEPTVANIVDGISSHAIVLHQRGVKVAREIIMEARNKMA